MVNKKHETLQGFILWSFNSSDPSVVALGILCVVMSVGQLNGKDHSELLSRLPCPQNQLFHVLFEKINTLVISDSDYASTKEGIEVVAMSARICVNFGLIKKSWVLHHQAIAYAQLLGFHRPHKLRADETAMDISRRHKSFMSLC